MDFPGGSVVKNLPARQEMQVQSLGWEDALEEEIATHSSILAWEIPWTEEPGGLHTVHGVTKELDKIEWLNNKRALGGRGENKRANMDGGAEGKGGSED